MYLILFVANVFYMFGVGYAQSYSEMDTFMEYLFNSSRYNKNLRPLLDQSDIMKVNLTQYITSIESLDISTGELLIYGYLEVTWKDELLTWDPASFYNKTVIPLQITTAWTPDIFLSSTSNTEDGGSLISQNSFVSAWVDYQGFIVVVPAGSYKTRCDIDTTLFPFDRHKCSFQFYVSNHDITELTLNSPNGTIGTTYFIPNGEWTLEDAKSVVVTITEGSIKYFSVSMLESSFTLRRRETFELINYYSPALLMSILNLLTCFVRPDSGERVTFAVTLYLAISFTFTAYIDRFPSNSLKMPQFSYALLGTNIINTLNVCWSIFVVHLASSQREVWMPIQRLVQCLTLKRRRNKSNKVVHVYTYGHGQGFEGENIRDEDASNLQTINGNRNNKKESVEKMTAIEIAIALDKLYFVSILISLCVSNITYISVFGWETVTG